ncbi:MAG: hypothetical protein GC182_08615 [Rhodopseudomonas sp.]|nr:hypothetical protein [Rhodopseudomonas sp.]
MACRCSERADDLREMTSRLAKGDIAGTVKAATHAARTLAEDARSGDLRRAALARVAAIRAVRK